MPLPWPRVNVLRQRVTMNFGRHCPAETAHSAGRQRPGAAHVLELASATKQVAYGRACLIDTIKWRFCCFTYGQRVSVKSDWRTIGWPSTAHVHAPIKSKLPTTSQLPDVQQRHECLCLDQESTSGDSG